MKKLLRIFTAAAIVLLFATSAIAIEDVEPVSIWKEPPLSKVDIIYNGEPAGIGYIDGNGRTLVNLRWLSDNLLCSTSGNTYGNKYCQIVRNDKIIAFRPDVWEMYIDHADRLDGLTIQIDTGAIYFETVPDYYMEADRLNFYVPLRYVAEELNMQVRWDDEGHRVLLTEETNTILDNCNPVSLWIDTDEFVNQGAIITKITSLDEYAMQFSEDNLYDVDFFTDSFLLIVAWTDGSGGFSADVADIRLADDGLVIFIRRHNSSGGIVTDAHVSHCLAFEVSRDFIEHEIKVAFIYTVDGG